MAQLKENLELASNIKNDVTNNRYKDKPPKLDINELRVMSSDALGSNMAILPSSPTLKIDKDKPSHLSKQALIEKRPRFKFGKSLRSKDYVERSVSPRKKDIGSNIKLNTARFRK